tara:strand:- start:48 stop:302 length:255 start_codon:yes stop_codon:yes gene_type:complete
MQLERGLRTRTNYAEHTRWPRNHFVCIHWKPPDVRAIDCKRFPPFLATAKQAEGSASLDARRNLAREEVKLRRAGETRSQSSQG